MQITIDTNNLSEMDIAMLSFLAGMTEDEQEPDESPAPAPAAKKAAPPAKKAEAEPEADGDAAAPTMSDAVAAATQLVSSGEAARVRAALAEVGATRVSKMSEGDIPAFLAALETAE